MKGGSESRRKQADSRIEIEGEFPVCISGHDRNHLVDQVTIHLEESSGADLIVVICGAIDDMFCPRVRERSRVCGVCFVLVSPARREKRDTGNFLDLALK